MSNYRERRPDLRATPRGGLDPARVGFLQRETVPSARQADGGRGVLLERGAGVNVIDVAGGAPPATVDHDLLGRGVAQLVAQVRGAAMGSS